MKDLGLMHYFLGLEDWQRPIEVFLSQGKYIVKPLERFGMVDCKSVSTPMELKFKKLSGSTAGPVLANPTEYCQVIGALMFLVNTFLDVCCVVNTLSQHMVDHNIHWVRGIKRLRYLCGMIDYGLRYTVGSMTLL